METWYNLNNYCRSHSVKTSLRTLILGKSCPKSEAAAYLVGEDGSKTATKIKPKDWQVQESKPFCRYGPDDTKIWRRLSLRSFRRRRERKTEAKIKPVIPEVLKTYDKQRKPPQDATNSRL